jgi:hypothetical protein
MPRLFALFCVGALVGCAGSATDSRTETSGKLSSNGLVLQAGELRQLSAAPLEGSPAAAALAATDDGLELLRYVATCALDDGDALEVGGDTLPGTLGLAPGWLHGTCDGSCQRWVSACLLAHANATGVHVPIWLRADHPALGASGDSPGGFTYQEGAFYGNVFADAGPQMFACAGRGLLAMGEGETIQQIDDVDAYFHHRLCTLEGECGVTSTGVCQAVPGGAPTCDDDAGAYGAYRSCHTGNFQRDEQPGTPAYDEVITVYLEP